LGWPVIGDTAKMKIEDAKVLLVDDDKVMRMFVGNLLARLGVRQVSEAADGHAGLALIGSFAPDVILSDIHMAPLDGIEFVKKLRSHPVASLRNIPVLFMSADTGSATLSDTALLGNTGYMAKPPALELLKVKLERALKFRSAQEPGFDAK
jgi:CheY-like chemotaxis protein